jgi:hypothetical protein
MRSSYDEKEVTVALYRLGPGRFEFRQYGDGANAAGPPTGVRRHWLNTTEAKPTGQG